MRTISKSFGELPRGTNFEFMGQKYIKITPLLECNATCINLKTGELGLAHDSDIVSINVEGTKWKDVQVGDIFECQSKKYQKLNQAADGTGCTGYDLYSYDDRTGMFSCMNPDTEVIMLQKCVR